MASNEVRVRLTAEDKISAKLDMIAKSLKNIEAVSIGTATKINYSMGKATRSTDGLRVGFGKLRDEAKRTEASISNLNSSLNNLFKGYVGFKGLEFLTGKVDDTISTVNRLNYVNYQTQVKTGVSPDELFNEETGKYTTRITGMTQETMDKIYTASRRVRGSYSDMVKDVSKLTVLAGDAFDNNIDNAIRFQEIMTEAYTIGGASAQEMHSSMYQLVQALGSGRLQGDELRSMIEGAPLAAKAIEKFAQKVYKTDKPLKEMASQGMITSKMVTNAILASAGEMDEAFAMTSVTFGQTMDMISSYATKAFEPVFIKLGEFLSSDTARQMVNELESFISEFANAILFIISGFSMVMEKLESININGIELIGIALRLLGVVIGYTVANAIFGTLFKIITGIPKPLLIILGILGLIAVAFSFLPQICGFVSSAIQGLGELGGRALLGIANMGQHVLAVLTAVGNQLHDIFNTKSPKKMEAKTLKEEIQRIESDFGGKVDADEVFGGKWLDNFSKNFAEGVEYGEKWKSDISKGMDNAFANIAKTVGIDKLIDPSNINSTLNVTMDSNDLLASIEDNTKKTADNTSLSEDDVKYLRDLAEMEWKKEFTTASIQIDMNNVNNISSDMDLDGIVTYLTDALYEQAEQFTDGVYI